jgi:hypothetical protein
MPDIVISKTSRPDRTLGRRLFWLVLSVCLLINGARLASSDEIAVYLLAESLVERGELNVPPDITPNGSWFEGRYYIWYEIGSTLLILPWYIAGQLISSALPIDAGLQTLVIRAFVSTMGAWMGALLAFMLFRAGRLFGYSVRLSVFLSLGLVFSTFLFPYLKTIIRDVPLAVFLLGTSYSLFQHKWDGNERKYIRTAGIYAGLGFLTKITFLMYLPMFVVYMFLALRIRDWKRTILFLAPTLAAALLTGWYNYARFGNALDLGYQGGTSFPTPILTGIFGLLLSPGKGFFWFAPVGILILWGGRMFLRKFRAEALLLAAIVISTLALYATYFAWGGDGSWGPRYLVVVLPLVFLAMGAWLTTASFFVKRLAIVLFIVGCVVQVGGVSVYQGNYLRKIGEFPFTRPFTDPEFMYKSHFVPGFSPIVGHWKMLTDNVSSHLGGDVPDLRPTSGPVQKRVPLSEESKPALLRTLDYWFMYAIYSGFPVVPILVLVLLVTAAVVIQAFLLRRSLKTGITGSSH